MLHILLLFRCVLAVVYTRNDDDDCNNESTMTMTII